MVLRGNIFNIWFIKKHVLLSLQMILSQLERFLHVVIDVIRKLEARSGKM